MILDVRPRRKRDIHNFLRTFNASDENLSPYNLPQIPHDDDIEHHLPSVKPIFDFVSASPRHSVLYDLPPIPSSRDSIISPRIPTLLPPHGLEAALAGEPEQINNRALPIELHNIRLPRSATASLLSETFFEQPHSFATLVLPAEDRHSPIFTPTPSSIPHFDTGEILQTPHNIERLITPPYDQIQLPDDHVSLFESLTSFPGRGCYSEDLPTSRPSVKAQPPQETEVVPVFIPLEPAHNNVTLPLSPVQSVQSVALKDGPILPCLPISRPVTPEAVLPAEPSEIASAPTRIPTPANEGYPSRSVSGSKVQPQGLQTEAQILSPAVLLPSAIALPSGPSSVDSGQILGSDTRRPIPFIDLNTKFSEPASQSHSTIKESPIESAPTGAFNPDDDLPALQSTQNSFSSLDSEFEFLGTRDLVITHNLPESRPVTPLLFADVAEKSLDLHKSVEHDITSFQLPQSRPQTPEFVNLPLPTCEQLHGLPISRPVTPFLDHEAPILATESIISDSAAPASRLQTPASTIAKFPETPGLAQRDGEEVPLEFPVLPRSLASSPKLLVQLREGSLLEHRAHTSLYSPLLLPEGPLSPTPLGATDILQDSAIYDLPDSLPTSPKSIDIKHGSNMSRWFAFPESESYSTYEDAVHAPGAISVPPEIDLGSVLGQNSGMLVDNVPGMSLPLSRRSSLALPIGVGFLPVLPHSRPPSILSISTADQSEVHEVSTSSTKRAIDLQLPDPGLSKPENHQIFETTKFPANDVAAPYAAFAEPGFAGLPGSARALSLEAEPMAREVQSSFVLAEGIILPHSQAGTSHLHFTPGKIDISSYSLPSGSFPGSQSEFNALSDVGTLKALSTVADRFALPPDATDSIVSFEPIEQLITSRPVLPLSEFSVHSVGDSANLESVKSTSEYFQHQLPGSTPSSPKIDLRLDVRPPELSRGVCTYSLWDVNSDLERPISRGYSIGAPAIVALPNLPSSAASSAGFGEFELPIPACPSLPETLRDDDPRTPTEEAIEIVAHILGPESISLPLSDMESGFSFPEIRSKAAGLHTLPYSRPPTPISFEEVEGPTIQLPTPSEYMLELPISPRSVFPLVDTSSQTPYDGILPPSHQTSPLLLPANPEPIVGKLPQTEAKQPECGHRLSKVPIDTLPSLPISPSLQSFKSYTHPERINIALPVSKPVSQAVSLIAPTLKADKATQLEPIVLPGLPNSPASFYIPAGNFTLGLKDIHGIHHGLPTSHEASPMVAPIAIAAPVLRQRTISVLELEREATSENHQLVQAGEYPMLTTSPSSIFETAWDKSGPVNFPQLPSSCPASPFVQPLVSKALPEVLCNVPEVAGFSIGREGQSQLTSAFGEGGHHEMEADYPDFAVIRTLPNSTISSIVADIHSFDITPHVAGLPASLISEPMLHKEFLVAPIENLMEAAIQSNLPASMPVSPRLPYPNIYSQQHDLPPSRPLTLVEVPCDVDDVVESEDLRNTPRYNFEFLSANRIGEAIALPESVPPLSAIFDDNRDRLSRNIPSSRPESVYEASSRIDDFQPFDLPRDVKLPYSVASSPASSVVFTANFGEETFGLPLSRAATERAEEMLPSPPVLPKISTENHSLWDDDGLPGDYDAVELPPSEASSNSIETSRKRLLPIDVTSQYTSTCEARPVQTIVPTQVPEALPESPVLPPSLSGVGVNLTPPGFLALPAQSIVSAVDPIVEAPILEVVTKDVLSEYQHALPHSPASSIPSLDDQIKGYYEIVLPDGALTTVSVGAASAVIDCDESDAANTVVPLPASPRTAPSLHSILQESANARLPRSPTGSHYTFGLSGGVEMLPDILVEEPQHQLPEAQLPRSFISVALPLSYLSSVGSDQGLDCAQARQLPLSRSVSNFDSGSHGWSGSVVSMHGDVVEKDIDAGLPDSPRSLSFVWPTGGDAAEAAFPLPFSRAMSKSSVTQIQPAETQSSVPLMLGVLEDDLPPLPSTLAPTPVEQEFTAPWGSHLLPHSHLDSPLDSPPIASPISLPAIAITLPPIPRSPNFRGSDHLAALDISHDPRIPVSAFDSPYIDQAVGRDAESIVSLAHIDKTSIINLEPSSSSHAVAILLENIPLPASPTQKPVVPDFSLGHIHNEVATLPYSYPGSPCVLPVETPTYEDKTPLPESYKLRIPLHQATTSYSSSDDEGRKEVSIPRAVAIADVNDFLIHDPPEQSSKVLPVASEIDVEDFLVQSPVASLTQEPLPRDLDVTEYILDSDSIAVHSEGMDSPRFSSGLFDADVSHFEDSLSGQGPPERSRSLASEKNIDEEPSGTHLENIPSVPQLPMSRDGGTFSEGTSRLIESAGSIPPAELPIFTGPQYEMPMAEESVPALSLSSPQEAVESFDTSSIASTSDPRNWLGYSDLPELPSSPLFEPAAKPERPWNESVYEPPQLQEIQWPMQDPPHLVSSTSPPVWSSPQQRGLIEEESQSQFLPPGATVSAPRLSRGVTITFPEYESGVEDAETNVIDEVFPPSSPLAREAFSPSDVDFIDELLPQFESPPTKKASRDQRRNSETRPSIGSRGSAEAPGFEIPPSIDYSEPVEFDLASPIYREPVPALEEQPVLVSPLELHLTSPTYNIPSGPPSEPIPEISCATPPSFTGTSQSPCSSEIPSDEFQAPIQGDAFEQPGIIPRLSPAYQHDDTEVLPSFEEYRLVSGADFEPDSYITRSPTETTIRGQRSFEGPQSFDEGFADAEGSPEPPYILPPDSPTSDCFPIAGIGSSPLLSTAEGNSLDDSLPSQVLDEPLSYPSPRQFTTVESSFIPVPLTTLEHSPTFQHEGQSSIPEVLAELEDEGVESDYYSGNDDDSESEIYRPASPPESILGPSKTVRFSETHELREYIPDDGETSPVESDTWSLPTTAGSSKPRRIRDSMPVPELDSLSLSPTNPVQPIASRGFTEYLPPSSIPYIPDEQFGHSREIPIDNHFADSTPELTVPSGLPPTSLPEEVAQDVPVLEKTRETSAVDTIPARRASVPNPSQERPKKTPKARRRNSTADDTAKAKKAPDQQKEAKTAAPRGTFFLPPLFRPSAYQNVAKKTKKPMSNSEATQSVGAGSIEPLVLEPLPRGLVDVEELLSPSYQMPTSEPTMGPVAEKPSKRRVSVIASSKQKPQITKEALTVPVPLPEPKKESAIASLEAVSQIKPSLDIALDPKQTETPVPARKLSITKPKTASPISRDVKKSKSPVVDDTPREIFPADPPTSNENTKPVSPAVKTTLRRSSISERSIPKTATTPKSPIVELKKASFFDIFPTGELPKLKNVLVESSPPTFSETTPAETKNTTKLKSTVTDAVVPKDLITQPKAPKDVAKSRSPVVEVLPPRFPKATIPASKEPPKSKTETKGIASREILEPKSPLVKDVLSSLSTGIISEKVSRSRAATVEKELGRIPPTALAALAIVPIARIAKNTLDSNVKPDRDAEEERRVSRAPKKVAPALRRRRSIDTIDSARDLVDREERKEQKLPISRKETQPRKSLARSVSPQRRKPLARSVSPQRRKPAPELSTPLLTDLSSRRQDAIKSRDAMRTDSPKSATTPLFPAIASWFSRNDNQQGANKKTLRSPSPEKPSRRSVLPSPERKHRVALPAKSPKPRSESPVNRVRKIELLPEKLPPAKIPKQRSKPRSVSPVKRTHVVEPLFERPPVKTPVDLTERLPAKAPEKSSEKALTRSPEKLPPIKTFKPRLKARSVSPKPRKARSISPRPRRAKFATDKKVAEVVREEAPKEERPHRRRLESHTKTNFLQTALEAIQRSQERGRKQERDLPIAEVSLPAEYLQYTSKKDDFYQVSATSNPLPTVKVPRTRSESPPRAAPLVSLPSTPLLFEQPKNRRLQKEPSPRRPAKELSPPRLAKEQSPRRPAKELSPARPTKAPSPREPAKVPSPTALKKELPHIPPPQVSEIPVVVVKPEAQSKRHRKRERRRKLPIRASPSPRQDSVQLPKATTAQKAARSRRRIRLPEPSDVTLVSSKPNIEKSREYIHQADAPSIESSPYDEIAPKPQQPRYIPEHDHLPRDSSHNLGSPELSHLLEASTPELSIAPCFPEVSPEQRRYEVELERASRLDREQRALDILEQQDEGAAAKERQRLYLLYQEQVDRYEREQKILNEMGEKERYDNDMFLYQQYLVQREQDKRYEKEIELRDKNRQEDMIVAIEKKKEAERRRREEYEIERRRQEEERKREYELAQERAAFLEREQRRKEEIRRLVQELQRRETERAELLEQQRIIEAQRQAEIQRLADEIQRREVERVAILESNEIAEQQRKDEIQRLAAEIHKRELDRAILLERKEDKERVKESVRREELEREIIETREQQIALENQRKIDRDVEQESRRRRLAEAAALVSLAESVPGSDIESYESSVDSLVPSKYRFSVVGVDDTPEYQRLPYYDRASLFHVSSYAGSVRSSVSSRNSDFQHSILPRPSRESLHSIAWAGHRHAEDNRRESLLSLASWSEDGTPRTSQDEFEFDNESEIIHEGPGSSESPRTPTQEPLMGLGIFTDPIIYDKDGNPISSAEDNIYDKDGNPIEVESEPTIGPGDVNDKIEPFEQQATPTTGRLTSDSQTVEDFSLVPLPASPFASPALAPQYILQTPHSIYLPLSPLISPVVPEEVELPLQRSISPPPFLPTQLLNESESLERRSVASHTTEIPFPRQPVTKLPVSRRASISAPLDAQLGDTLPEPLQEGHVLESTNSSSWEPILKSRASSPASILLDHNNRGAVQLPYSGVASEYTIALQDLETREQPQVSVHDETQDLPAYLPPSIAPSLDEPITPTAKVPQFALPISRAVSIDICENEMEVESRPAFDFNDFDEYLPDSDSEGYEEIGNMFAPPSVAPPRLPESRVSSMYSLHDAYLSVPKSIEVDPLLEDSDDEGSLDIEQLGRGVWETVCSLPESKQESAYCTPPGTASPRGIEEPHNFQLPSPRSEGSTEYLFVPKRRGSIVSLPPTVNGSEYQASESIPQVCELDDILLPQTESLHSEAPTVRLPREAGHEKSFNAQLPISRAASEYENPRSVRDSNFFYGLPALRDGTDSTYSLDESHIPHLELGLAQIPTSGRASPYAESLALARSLFGDIPGLPQSEDISTTSRLHVDQPHFTRELPLSRQSSILFQRAPEYQTRSEAEIPSFDDNESRPSSSHTIKATSPYQNDVHLPISRQSSLYLHQPVTLSRQQVEVEEGKQEAAVDLLESRPATSHTYRRVTDNSEVRDLPLSRTSSAYFEEAAPSSFETAEQSIPRYLPESRPTTSHTQYVHERHQDRGLPLSRASSFYQDEDSEQTSLPHFEQQLPRDLPDSRPSTSYVLASPYGPNLYPQLPLTRSATPKRTTEDEEETDVTPRPSPRQVPRDLVLPISRHPSAASLRDREAAGQSRDLPESGPISSYADAPTPLPSRTAFSGVTTSPNISPLIGPPSHASPSLSETSPKNALALIPRAALEPANEGKLADSLRALGIPRDFNSITPNEIEEPGDTVSVFSPRHVSVSPLSGVSSFRSRRPSLGTQRQRRQRRIPIQEYAQGPLDIATPEKEVLAAAGVDVHFDQETGTIEVSWSEEKFGEAPTVDISVYYPGDTDGSLDDSDLSRPSSVVPSPTFDNYSLEERPAPVEASTRADERDLFLSPELGPTDLPAPVPQLARPINRNIFPEAQSSSRGIGLGIEGLDTPYRELPETPSKQKAFKSSSLPNRRVPLPALAIPPTAESIYSEVSPARSSTISLSGVSSVSPLEPGVELPPPSPIQQLPPSIRTSPVIRASPVKAPRRPPIRRDTFTEADNKALSLLFSDSTSAGTTPTPTQKAPQPLSQYFQKKSNPTTPTPGPSQSRQTPQSRGSVGRGSAGRGSAGRRSINTIQGAYPSPETSPELAPLAKSPGTAKTTPRLRRLSTSAGSAGRSSGRRYTSVGADLEPLQEGVAVISSAIVDTGSSSNTTPRPGSPKATPPILTILKKRGTMEPLREGCLSSLEGSMSTITSPTPAPRPRTQVPNTRARAASNISSPNATTTPGSSFQFDNPPAPSSSRKGKERSLEYDNKEVFEAYGDTSAVPISPERPISVNLRKRQSLQMLDLETRIRTLNEQNSQLSGELARLQHDANSSQKKMEAVVYKHLQERSALVEALEIRSLAVSERESQIETLKKNLEWYKQEDDNLTQQLQQLRINNEQLIATEATQRQQYERKREQLHNLSQQHSDLQEQYTALSSGLNDIINQQVATVTKAKDTEIEKLKQELATARNNANKLQVKLNAMNRYIDAKDEVFFARSCGHLFNAVQQWCVKFSKFSDTATCVDFDTITNESVKDLVESVVLDGSDVRAMLRDRVKRREIFMAMTMSLIWELIFCRYMFGLDAEERKKLKSLEEKLNEVGPPAAVHMWRATTLQLLSQRRSFRAALPAATEPVVQEIYRTLHSLLPPPSHLQQQVVDSLRTIVNLAVTLSIDMRTQRAEYFMWEAPDNSIGKPVDFVTLRMNNRGNEGLTNEQLEKMGAMVRVVLFPLVTKRGDENGDGYDVETVIAPMQVLVSRRPTSTTSASSSKRVKLDQRTPR